MTKLDKEWFIPVKGHIKKYKGTYEFVMKKASILFDLKEEANSHKADVWPIYLQGTNKVFDRGYQVSLSNKLSELKLNFLSKTEEVQTEYD